MPRAPRLPSYRLHKPSGRAVVTLGGHDHYLGPHGSPESHAEYNRLLAEFLAAGGIVPPEPAPDLTVAEVLDAYWAHAQLYYRQEDPDSGQLVPTTQVDRIKYAIGPVRDLYGHTPAARFGPLALQAVQGEMCRRGWCRTYTNNQVDCVKRVFKWATAQEMIPSSIYEGLRTVSGLKAGRTDARESEPVRPVPEQDLQAVRRNVAPTIVAMIDLQLYSGCRPGEITSLRPAELDRSGAVWLYRPRSHKKRFRGKERIIYFGPRAQAVLLPYLDREPAAYCFDPRESAAAYLAARGWKTGHVSKVYKNPRYNATSYSTIIRLSCNRLGIEPSWHPHQLRHSAATRLTAEFGIEVARVILGHDTLSSTQLYAEVDAAKAIEVISRAG